jgi:hypothetical protein
MVSFLFNKIKPWLKVVKRQYEYRKEYFRWSVNGKLLPPPHLYKQITIRKYKRKFSLDTFIESGTYLGEMVEAQRNRFQKIISIELSEYLFASAKNKFQKYKNIEILYGDSGELIKDIVANLNKPAIFWLDGHYSGGNTAKGKVETPIINELEAIIQSNKDHIILIDDARQFNGNNDYPTIKYLEEFVAKGGYYLLVKNDIIRLTKNL